MLSRAEANELLVEHGKGAVWTKHCLAVAEAALMLGQRLEGHRLVDHQFLYSAALLHDIGRCVSHDPILHGVEGYNLLTRLGHRKEAFVCASHILFGLDAEEAVRFGLPACDFRLHTIEQHLVPLVDFLIEGDKPTTLDRRFRSLRNRNVGNAFFLGKLDFAYLTASSLLQELSKEIGESIEDVVGSRR